MAVWSPGGFAPFVHPTTARANGAGPLVVLVRPIHHSDIDARSYGVLVRDMHATDVGRGLDRRYGRPTHSEPARAMDGTAGPGGRQILVEDPDGNPVELFEPRR